MFKIQMPEENDDRLYYVYNKGEYTTILKLDYLVDTVDENFEAEFMPVGNQPTYLLKTKVPVIVSIDDMAIDHGRANYCPIAITEEEYNDLFTYHKLQWPERSEEVERDLNRVKKLIKTPSKIKKIEE